MPTRAAATSSTACRGRRRVDRAVVGHQRRRPALERVERPTRRARGSRRSRRAPRAPCRRAAASGSGRTAARRARSESAVAIGACVWTTAPGAEAVVDAQVQVELRGRRERALDQRGPRGRPPRPDRLELGQRGAGGRDRDQVAGAGADVAGRAEDETLGGEPPAAAATCSVARLGAACGYPRPWVPRAHWLIAEPRRARPGDLPALGRAPDAKGRQTPRTRSPAAACSAPAPRPAGAGARAGPGAGRHAPAAAVTARSADVAIVGAGFAGLTAARELERRRPLGGRARGARPRRRPGAQRRLGGGEITERGATFAGPTQDHILALAKKMRVGTFNTYNTGDNLYIANGQRAHVQRHGPDRLGAARPGDPRRTSPRSSPQLDQMSTAGARRRPVGGGRAPPTGTRRRSRVHRRRTAVTPQFRKLVPVATRPIFGAEPRELSLLFVLFYIASSGNEENAGTFERNFNTRDGAQMCRFVGGSQLICQKVARKLGRSVVLGSPVRADRPERPRGVTVHSDRVEVEAKRVIVAVPPTLTGRIDYQPGLPAERDQLIERLPAGDADQGRGRLRPAVLARRGAERDGGLEPRARSTRPSTTRPRTAARASCSASSAATRRGASARSPPAERRAARGRQLRRSSSAPRPRIRASTSRPTGRARTGPAAARWRSPARARCWPTARRCAQPVGRIHWAGTETSTYWNGYMDGAVRSGERAAHEVLDRL